MTQLLFVLFCDHLQHFSQDFKRNLRSFPELTQDHFDVDYTFCKFFWECHVDLNYVNIKSLDDKVKEMKEYKNIDYLYIPK